MVCASGFSVGSRRSSSSVMTKRGLVWRHQAKRERGSKWYLIFILIIHYHHCSVSLTMYTRHWDLALCIALLWHLDLFIHPPGRESSSRVQQAKEANPKRKKTASGLAFADGRRVCHHWTFIISPPSEIRPLLGGNRACPIKRTCNHFHTHPKKVKGDM